MYCQNCGSENSERNMYCSSCGAKLMHRFLRTSMEETQVTNDKSDISFSAEKNIDSIEENMPEPLFNGESDTVPFKEPNDLIFFYRPGDYAYAKIRSVKEGKVYFDCIDSYSRFTWPINIFMQYERKEPVVGESLWVQLSDKIYTQNNGRCEYKAYSVANNKPNKSSYFQWAITRYNVDDIIAAPVSKYIERSILFVNMTPYYSGVAIKSSLKKKFSEYSDCEVRLFRIKKIEPENEKIELEELKEDISLKKLKSFANLWNKLPEEIPSFIIPDYVLKQIKEDASYDSLFGASVDKVDICTEVSRLYKDAYREKNIQISSKEPLQITFDTKKKDLDGVPISIICEQTKQERWMIKSICFAGVPFYFDLNVYVENWDNLLYELSNLALKGEEWDFKDDVSHGDNYVLKQYLIYTYYKAMIDDTVFIRKEQDYSIFNTGLVDNAYQAIYGCLKRNDSMADIMKRPWKLEFFGVPGKKEAHGSRLIELFRTRDLPSSPKYIDKEHLENIFYDADIMPELDWPHIIKDNFFRLPLQFVRQSLSSWNDVANKVDLCINEPKNKKNLDELREMVIRNDDYIRRIQSDMQNSLETARKYCKWNYKTAIPIYYPRKNKLSILLPLDLTMDGKTDIALVIERFSNGNYQGQTILTLDMAYLDARLICRPNSEWLTISAISDVEEDV